VKHKHKWVKPPKPNWRCTKIVGGVVCHQIATAACLADECIDDDGRCAQHAPKPPAPRRARTAKLEWAEVENWLRDAADDNLPEADEYYRPAYFEATLAELARLRAAGIARGKTRRG
jgi:hypothetical protein